MSNSDISSQASAKQNGKADRIEWVDAGKGIGIILVVIGHAIVGLRDSALVSLDSMLVYVHYLIYTFHMPMFFFLSGIFIARRIAGGAYGFAKTSTTKMGRSYLIWLPIQMLMLGLAGNLANKPLDGTLLTYISILWEPKYNFWFIYALILMNLMAALVIPFFGASIFLIASFFLYSLAQWAIVPAAFWGLVWFAPFYGVGIIFGLHPVKLKPGRLGMAALSALFAIVWLYIAHELKQRNSPPWGSPTFAAAITGSAATLLLVSMAKGRVAGFLSYLGREALTIYLVHVIFTAGVRIVLNKMLHVEDVYVILVLATGFGIAGPLLMKKAADRMGIAKQVGLA